MEIDKEEFQKLAGLYLGEMFRRALPESKKELASEYEKKYRKYYIDEGHYDKPEILKSLNPTYVIDKFKTLKEIIKYKNN